MTDFSARLWLDKDGQRVEIALPSEHFTIDPTELDRELCALGPRLVYYGELEAMLNAEVERKDNNVRRYEADLDLAIRRDAKERNQKITEAYIASCIKSNDQRTRLLEDLARSRQSFNTARWAARALLAKKDCLIAITYREKALIQTDKYAR